MAVCGLKSRIASKHSTILPLPYLIMILRWLRDRKRRKLAAQPTPPLWYDWLEEATFWFDRWEPERQQKMIKIVKILIAEKYWEGCAGFALIEKHKVFIAAQAAMMLMGIDNYYFDKLHTILVFPNQFNRQSGDGVFVWKEWRIGEAWQRGPIVIAWKEFLEGLEYGQNVVIHELAHHIDGILGDMNGEPAFGDRQSSVKWRAILKRELQNLNDSLRNDRETLLDPYGAESPVEFFAVCSEAFFESPQQLATDHPQLYQALTTIYHSDPATW